MNERYQKKMYAKSSRIKTIWIIVSAIFVILIANGCAGMRSVRGTKAYYSQKEEQKEQANVENTDKNDHEYNDMLSEFETKFHKPEKESVEESIAEVEPEFKEVAYADNNIINEANESQTNNRRLPTLNEQVQSLSNGQSEIKDRVNNLQNDVDDMKGTLNEIKDVLYDIKGEKPLPKTGLPSPSTANTVKNEKKSNNNIILPDEKVSDQEPKISPKPVKTKRKTNSTKPKENKTFTVKPVNYIAPDKTEEVEPKQEDKPREENEGNAVNAKEKYDIAFNQFKSRRFNEAISLFEDIVKTEADMKIVSDSYYWLGESYFGMEQYGKAIEYFNKVSSAGANSKLDNAQLMLAECLIRSGQIKDAKNAFQKLIAKYPDSSFVPRARKMLQQL